MIAFLIHYLLATHGAANDAASYCFGSLLWSAFWFVLGSVATLAFTAMQDHLGEKNRDHT